MKKHDYPKKSPSGRSLRRFLMMTFLFYSIASSAGVQSATFDVNFEKSSLEQVIMFLKEKSNYDFVYRKGMLPSDVQVSLKLRDATVEEVLEKSLPQNLSFEISNNVVVINRTTEQQAPPRKTDGRFVISGAVYEIAKDGVKTLLPRVAVIIEEQSLHAITDVNGQFVINNVPQGQITLKISMLGKVPMQKTLNVEKDTAVEIIMENDNFRIQDVVVTAVKGKAGEANSYVISRTAMDHLQATNLNDVLSLLPGKLQQNQNLSYISNITLRSATADNMNSMGVLIIQDGAPINNNANMQFINSTNNSTVAGVANTAGPTGGIDARNISTDNIESIEVIDGIASVEYGDATSGLIIINSKAGRDPLRITAKTNPNLYMFSVGAGYNVGEKNGALNFGFDYLNNTRSLVESYAIYQRSTGNLMYSGSFFDDKLRSTTSLRLLYAKNSKEERPDMDDKSWYFGEDVGITLMTRGTYDLNLGWLRSISYNFSAEYTKKNAVNVALKSGGMNYVLSETDGSVISSYPGKIYEDITGNVITNIPPNEQDLYSVYIPDAFTGHETIEGREIGLYGKITANFVKTKGNLNNRILLGADIKSDGNRGKGTYWDVSQPPLSTGRTSYQTIRPRNNRDIPFLTQFGAFLEDNLSYNFLNGRKFNLQAGVRYDHVSVLGGQISPRINASVDIIPQILTLRAGYGIMTKVPSLIYIYPQDAYFGLVNLNTYTTETEASRQHLIMTTHVREASNKNLELAQNKKTEIGFDLKLGQVFFNIIGFRERLDNGYMMDQTLESWYHVIHRNYSFDYDLGKPYLKSEHGALLRYYMPTNNYVFHTDGVQFTLDLGRFDAIRMAFNINGAWLITETSTKGYTFYTREAEIDTDNKGVSIYEDNKKVHTESFITSLRTTYNIPELGFVVTLTAQTTWFYKNWTKFNDIELPMRYISQQDGKIYDFPYANIPLDDVPSEWKQLVRPLNDQNGMVNKYSPLFCFHVNVTKEIGDMMRASFFANNMFRSYKVEKNDITRSNDRRNSDFFFGFELALKF